MFSIGLKLAAELCIEILRDSEALQTYSKYADQSVSRYGFYADAFIKGFLSTSLL